MAFFSAVMKVVDQKIEFKRLKRTRGESKQEYENWKWLERNKRKGLRRQLKRQEGKQAAVAARKKIKSLGELHSQLGTALAHLRRCWSHSNWPASFLGEKPSTIAKRFALLNQLGMS